MLREVLLGLDVGLAVALLRTYLQHRRPRVVVAASRGGAGGLGPGVHVLVVPPRLGGGRRLAPPGAVLRVGLAVFAAYNAVLAACAAAGCL